MLLIHTFAEIRRSLASPRFTRTFAEGATRRPALAGFASPLAVLAAIGPRSSLTVEERDVILVALLAELRETKVPVWQSILVLAFEPLIVRVRARLGQPKAVRFGRSMGDDLDQRVLLAFVEAACSLRVASHAARMLRLATERKIFTDQQAEREAPDPAEYVDDTYLADPFETTTREKAAANEVVRIIEAEGGDDLRDMMLATRANDETLRAYVARTYPEATPRERATLHRRLTAAATKMERTLRKRARRPEQRRFVTAA